MNAVLQKKPSCILIVDDEEYGRDTLEMLLIHEEYQLVFADNGYDALQQAHTLVPDLILLDIMMPGMDGFEVCAKLRADPLLGEVPVILVTALDDQDSRLRGLKAGADDFISKPFNRVELRARIKTITRLNRYHRLLSERSQFEWVVEHSQDAYLRLDGDGLVRYVNHSARQLFKLTEREVLAQQDFMQLVGDDFRYEPSAAWENWPQSSEHPRYLLRPEGSDAHALWLQVDIFSLPLNRQDELLIKIRDVSEEITLKQRTWSFQALVSHKLRTPLSGLGALQLARMKLEDGDGNEPLCQEVLELIDMAENNERRLHHEIVEILTYIDSPCFVAKDAMQSFPLGELPDLLLLLREPVHKRLDLHGLDDTVAALHLGLSTQGMKIILQELLENARKFHPDKQPEIDLFLRQEDRNSVVLQVRDNGVCLSPEYLSRVWLPYYQGEKYFTGELHGMGLGLPTIASIISSIGGYYEINNRSDRPGVVITLRLPLYPHSVGKMLNNDE